MTKQTSSPEKPIRAFVHLSRTWYAATALEGEEFVDQVMLSLDYYPHGGIEGEVAVNWYASGEKITPQLEALDDSWAVLAQFLDVIMAMGKVDSQNISPTDFTELLKTCGFTDLTPTERPDRKRINRTEKGADCF